MEIFCGRLTLKGLRQFPRVRCFSKSVCAWLPPHIFFITWFEVAIYCLPFDGLLSICALLQKARKRTKSVNQTIFTFSLEPNWPLSTRRNSEKKKGERRNRRKWTSSWRACPPGCEFIKKKTFFFLSFFLLRRHFFDFFIFAQFWSELPFFAQKSFSFLLKQFPRAYAFPELFVPDCWHTFFQNLIEVSIYCLPFVRCFKTMSSVAKS